MTIQSTVKKNHYQDSMNLMRISKEIGALPGVKKAAAIMATDANIKMLMDANLIDKTFDSVTANDLIVAVETESDNVMEEVMEKLDSLLKPKQANVGDAARHRVLDSDISNLEANLLLVSVPGQFAKIEVAKAIDKGLHTFLFSDNLTIEEEIELKERAQKNGLLMMGPGCGTAIINGVGLGFSNVINRGPIGVVGAAGTGLQEVTCLINNLGSGITHAIGVGGRDLSEGVGGIMTLESLKMLQNDDNTEVLIIISKPPSATVADKIINAIGESKKPTVVCLLGNYLSVRNYEKIIFASTLEEAVLGALQYVNKNGKKSNLHPKKSLKKYSEKIISLLKPSQHYVRGLYSGGTLCYEAQQILTPILGEIYSNAPLNKRYKLKNSYLSQGHTCVDLGEEEFTLGHPHPMIDATIRNERLIQEASDPNVSVILFDIVLGYVASPDPAGDILSAIKEAKSISERQGCSLAFISHVCGTEHDPQSLRVQMDKLQKEGVQVFASNALASKVAGWIANRGVGDLNT